MRVKRKDLEIFLEQLEKVTEPKLELEQYPTPSRVAANMLWFAGVENDDITGKKIFDLGCGTGTLALGAAYMGAKEVIGVDIDCDSIIIAKRNSINFSLEDKCNWICMNVENCKLKNIDTVIMNPPFGMRKESISRDRTFIEVALSLTKIVYTIIPYADKTREFFKEFCKEFDAEIDKIIQMDFEIKHQFEFHKKEKHMTVVDLYRIIK
ncbi:MAG: methyltransferase [Candidatus Heimdallarchaeota archaeon]